MQDSRFVTTPFPGKCSSFFIYFGGLWSGLSHFLGSGIAANDHSWCSFSWWDLVLVGRTKIPSLFCMLSGKYWFSVWWCALLQNFQQAMRRWAEPREEDGAMGFVMMPTYITREVSKVESPDPPTQSPLIRFWSFCCELHWACYGFPVQNSTVTHTACCFIMPRPDFFGAFEIYSGSGMKNQAQKSQFQIQQLCLSFYVWKGILQGCEAFREMSVVSLFKVLKHKKVCTF